MPAGELVTADELVLTGEGERSCLGKETGEKRNGAGDADRANKASSCLLTEKNTERSPGRTGIARIGVFRNKQTNSLFSAFFDRARSSFDQEGSSLDELLWATEKSYRNVNG